MYNYLARNNNVKFFKSWLKGHNPIYEIYLKGKKVVDFGCGPTSIILKDKENFVGFDLNERVVKELQGKGCKAKLGTVDNVPFDDSSFDTVHCSNVIEHLDVDTAYKMVKEMARVLKVGGKILIITPMPNTVWNTFGHVKPYTPMSLKKLLREESYESFDTITNLKYEYTFYYGKWGKNKLMFLLSTILSLISISFAGSHLTVLRKTR
jgi:ubiquinone/menaquinone biosynthesis C-methylase UbiE